MEDDKFRELIVQITKRSKNEINLNADTDLVSDLGLDSLQITELFYHIEDKFECEIDYSRLKPEHIRNYGLLKQFIASGSEKSVA